MIGKARMKNGVLCILLCVIHSYHPAFADSFTACEGKYALCTKALCKPIPGKTDIASCTCKVINGFSAGTKACELPKITKEGEQIYSRYYPIQSYVSCKNNRPWAWCLDKPCIIDKADPSKAYCSCSIIKDLGKYVIVTDQYNDKTCTMGLYSSATPDQVDQVTEFLKTQPSLQPFPMMIYEKN